MAYNFQSMFVREIRYMMPWFQHSFLVPVTTSIFPSGLVHFLLTVYIPFIFISAIPHFHFRHSRFHFRLTKKYESGNERCVFSTISVRFHPYVSGRERACGSAYLDKAGVDRGSR
jgi:hypothetical protein